MFKALTVYVAVLFFMAIVFRFVTLRRQPDRTPSIFHPWTAVPLYFMNLDRSPLRKNRMEQVFGSWSNLTRIAAVDAEDEDQLRRSIEFGDMRPNDYMASVHAFSLGEVALCATALHALKTSYENGDEAMVLLEDDMSDILIPHWPVSLDKVIETANTEKSNWDVIQLHVVAYSAQRSVFDAWKPRPDRLFVQRTTGMRIWGGGAQAFSRQGMQKFIKVFESPNGKFDCRSTKDRKMPSRCIADFIYWKVPGSWNALMRIPPLFTYELNEGSTFLRQSSEGVGGNDKFVGHFQSVMDSLRSNIEAKAAQEAPTVYADPNLNVHDLRYMRMNAMEMNPFANNEGT
eukprot:Lankesteria_metandrocarpae@DN3960_c0_g1_i1.p1